MSYPKSQQWHSTGLEAVFGHLQAAPTGLTTVEAQQRLEEVGPNALPHQSTPSRWKILLRQFRSPLIYILGLAAGVSAVIGDGKDAGFIIAVLAINAAIGSYQEWRAEQSSRALQHLLKIRASVIRDGEVCEIDAEAIVPGDVVWLESGNRVPADLRLLQTHNLDVDESLNRQPGWENPLSPWPIAAIWSTQALWWCGVGAEAWWWQPPLTQRWDSWP